MDNEATHRKRLAAILRYIASMHQTLHEADANTSFVQTIEKQRNDDDDLDIKDISDFFQYENEGDYEDGSGGGVLFSTENFRELLAMQSSDPTLFASAPFAFYAAASSQHAQSNNNKRTLAGTLKNSLSSSSPIIGTLPEKACWLRLTRTQVAAPPPVEHPLVEKYLQDWLRNTPNVPTIERLLTKRRLERAPKVPPAASIQGGHEIRSFLRRYKKYLRRRSYQRLLEPIYNRLFEYIQSNTHDDELVWGLGHARILLPDNHNGNNHVFVNGPVLEVHVEVELSRDGALLVRPREHTGVTLNRSVVTALSNDPDLVKDLFRSITDEEEPSSLSPGQPSTYTPILKRIALELSAGGRFQPSSAKITDFRRLSISEGWCLFARPKPSSVWARDAMQLATQISSNDETMVLPQAAWALTHGPGSLAPPQEASVSAQTAGLLHWLRSRLHTAGRDSAPSDTNKPLFPLPASDTQNRIAELLLSKDYPAVVCEGPPGSGKTQTIANIICAYLCRGKSVLVTSKNAPALSVLRNRLPKNVQELCVDVSMSESAGMRQLQQTVERLANKVASVNSDMESQKYLYLRKNIEEHETELAEIDSQICQHSESIRQAVKSREGSCLLELSRQLIMEVPWLMRTISKWSPQEVSKLRDRVASLVLVDDDADVTGYAYPPSAGLVSLCASRAGIPVSRMTNAVRHAVTKIPIVGSGMKAHTTHLEEELELLRLRKKIPESQSEWVIVLNALKHAQAINKFELEVWNIHRLKEGWPDPRFLSSNDLMKMFHKNLEKACQMKELAFQLNVWDKIELTSTCRSLDAKRSLLAARIQSLAEELVNATVVAELSNSFSVEAQSALIRFAQIAGKTRFSKSQQTSKMSQRQRRRRKEYLDAFDKCCRFIPCWILTTSQISDYLPPECLFDLVIIDESSQSDVTVVPGMLRGRQWLVVGDGKQVSPTESFVSEEQIDSLRASLPYCALEDSLLPGQSFFDLCAQAFPNGRVVLNEHFRCASEIISFSNRQFYNGQLIPLRLPTKSERITPSILDVKIRDGEKNGKVNEKEADEIVRLISEFVTTASAPDFRSIGVISLMGDEQSRLIRGRLLDSIGPHNMARHNILVGDPPVFQGAERDVIFLSMVCSPGKAPTQNQLMHFQRANVALSRARDQCVLVRSLEISDIPNNDDMKIPIIEFFQTGNAAEITADEMIAVTEIERANTVEGLLAKLLVDERYNVRTMGVVWNNALCIEHPDSDMRAAIIVDCAEDSKQDWQLSYRQQKAIERVGWKCLRIDALSLVASFSDTIDSIVRFLSATGVEAPTILYDELEEEEEEEEEEQKEEEVAVDDVAGIDNHVDEVDANEMVIAQQEVRDDIGDDQADDADVVVVSSDDDDSDAKPRARPAVPEPVSSGPVDTENDEVDASNFGSVVDLGFLRNDDNADAEDNDRASGRRRDSNEDDGKESESDSPEDSSSRRAARRRRKYRRLDSYQRDGRWHLNRKDADDDPDGYLNDWYDEKERAPKGGEDDDVEDRASNVRDASMDEAYAPDEENGSGSN